MVWGEEITAEQEIAIRKFLYLLIMEGKEAGTSTATACYRYDHMGRTYAVCFLHLPINVVRFNILTPEWEADVSLYGPNTASARNKINGKLMQTPYRMEHLPLFNILTHRLSAKRELVCDEAEVLALWVTLFGKRHKRLPWFFKGDHDVFAKDFMMLKMDERMEEFQ